MQQAAVRQRVVLDKAVGETAMHIYIYISREMYIGHARLCVCLSVCLSAATCPLYCRDSGVTWGNVVGPLYSCALLGGFAIGAWVSLP